MGKSEVKRMKVPYVNLGLQNELILEDLMKNIKKLITSGQFILGEEVHNFERSFADRVGTRYAVGVNSGTDAIFLTLKMYGIGPGDEVITVPNSFVATVAAIELTGATPVLIDVDVDQNMNPNLLEAAITSKTKAIIPVHLTGRPAKMEQIMEIANRHQLLVVEDCAQAVNARLNGQHVGTFGHAGTFSLHPLKNLGACGDAGIVVTNDEELAKKLRKARNHGLINRDECEHWGYNSRLDALQAAILNVKLRHLDHWTTRRREIAKRYIEQLADLPLRLPVEEENQFCVYHAFVIQLEERDALKAFLDEQGIETKIHYPIPIHKQKAAQNRAYGKLTFAEAERQAKQILSLPIYPELKNEEVDAVIQGIHAFFTNKGRVNIVKSEISFKRNTELRERANQVLVGGVSAAWNHLSGLGPIYFDKAKGSRITDVDGNEYIDYLVGWGSLFLGHNPKVLHDAIQQALEIGFGFQYESQYHVELAEKIIELVPGAEMVRLCNSGTEATMNAIRLARLKTGKNKLIKFEGHFHGQHDYLLYSMDTSPYLGEIRELGNIQPVPGSGGIPGVIEQLVIPLPFNDIEAFMEAVKRNKDDLAAIILEPISLNIGCVMPTPEFLQTIRKVSEEEGIVLIFDEVLTGFRVALGGAQEYFGIIPDLACFGKAFGCGMPIAALAGKKEFMLGLEPIGKGQMSGTNTGRLITVIGTLNALKELEKPGTYEYITNLNDMFVREFTWLMERYSIPGYVQGVGGRVGIHFGLRSQPTDYRHIVREWNKEFTLACFRKAFYEQGLYGFFLPLKFCPEPVTMCLAHTVEDIHETLNRVETIFKQIPYFEEKAL
jgi:glutamate-1-semialdehyde 2,1-aminomutase